MFARGGCTPDAQPSRVADILFSRVVFLLEDIVHCSKLHKRKVERLRRFFCASVPRHNGDDLFQLFRLLLPKLDYNRGSFGIKEKRFAGLLAEALGACPERAVVAKDWMQMAHHMKLNFPVVMQNVLLNHYCPTSLTSENDTLTLVMVNAALDQLAAIAGGAVWAAAQPDDERPPLRSLTGRQATSQQAAVLRDLLRRCTPDGARWLISIVLREELPIGMGDKTVLNAFHVDAHAAFTSCSDLRLVLDELCQPGSAWRRREVEPGLNAAPQLASRVDGGPEAAAACMKGRPFLVETKFDGWRIQLHVTAGAREDSNGVRDEAGDGTANNRDRGESGFYYFSRNVKDHGKHSNFYVLDSAVAQFLKPDPDEAVPRVVLDGEMLVWNKTRRSFEPFGMLEMTIRAVVEGWEPSTPVKSRDLRSTSSGEDRPLQCPSAGELEVVYVVFDILYLRDTSVTHLPLRERKGLLASVIRHVGLEGGLQGSLPLGARGAVTFRLEVLLPDRAMFDGKVHCWTCSTAQQASEVYENNVAACEEGVVMKALDEPYHLRSRNNAWIKIKPDYLTQGDFDAVILGQRYDHTTSQVSVGGVYLLGLLEGPAQAGQPATYVTFATVGSGVSREQRQMLLEPKLSGNLAASPRGLEVAGPAARLRAVPRWCRATGSRDEWPDWWVRDPDRSVVVQVNADVRLVRTGVFAAGYTTRFPRITRVREDKSPREATTLKELQKMVRRAAAGSYGGNCHEARAGAVGTAAGAGQVSNGLVGRHSPSFRRRPCKLAQPRQPRMMVSPVPRHLLTTDLSQVPVHFDLLRGAYVTLEGLYGATAETRRGELSRLVRLIGGKCSANYVPKGNFRTSYTIVDEWVESCHGCERCRDLLRSSWLEDCYLQRRLIWPPKPSHAWRLGPATLSANTDKVDAFGDFYFETLDDQDLAALLNWHVHPAAANHGREELLAGAARVEIGQKQGRWNTGATEGAGTPPKSAKAPHTLVGTAGTLLHLLEAEMLDHGDEPQRGLHRIFAGVAILVLDMSAPLAKATEPPPTAAEPASGLLPRSGSSTATTALTALDTDIRGEMRAEGTDGTDVSGGLAGPERRTIPLLHGVCDVDKMKMRWVAEAAKHQLQEMRLAVLCGGGEVVDAWSPAVTHLVLYDGVMETNKTHDARKFGVSMATEPLGRSCDDVVPIAAKVPPLSTDSVMVALQSKCTQPQWEAACAEVAAYVHGAGSRPRLKNSGDGCGCSCLSTDSASDETHDLSGEECVPELQHHQPHNLSSLPCRIVHGASAGDKSQAQRVGPHAKYNRWQWQSTLAQVLHRLGAACGSSEHNLLRAAPGGGVQVTDWRWIRDNLVEAKRTYGAERRLKVDVGPDGRGFTGCIQNHSRVDGVVDGDPWHVTGDPTTRNMDQTLFDATPPYKYTVKGKGVGYPDDEGDSEVESESESGICALTTWRDTSPATFMRLPEALYAPRLTLAAAGGPRGLLKSASSPGNVLEPQYQGQGKLSQRPTLLLPSQHPTGCSKQADSSLLSVVTPTKLVNVTTEPLEGHLPNTDLKLQNQFELSLALTSARKHLCVVPPTVRRDLQPAVQEVVSPSEAQQPQPRGSPWRGASLGSEIVHNPEQLHCSPNGLVPLVADFLSPVAGTHALEQLRSQKDSLERAVGDMVEMPRGQVPVCIESHVLLGVVSTEGPMAIVPSVQDSKDKWGSSSGDGHDSSMSQQLLGPSDGCCEHDKNGQHRKRRRRKSWLVVLETLMDEDVRDETV